MVISFCWPVCHSFSTVTELLLDSGLAAEVVFPLVSWFEFCWVALEAVDGLDNGHWTLDIGQWTMDSGQGTFDNGQ